MSRMRYISAQTDLPIRFLGLSTALANAADLADWLGINKPVRCAPSRSTPLCCVLLVMFCFGIFVGVSHNLILGKSSSSVLEYLCLGSISNTWLTSSQAKAVLLHQRQNHCMLSSYRKHSARGAFSTKKNMCTMPDNSVMTEMYFSHAETSQRHLFMLSSP